MSFMNSGAECSSSANPMAQFAKHTSEDRTLQHERFGLGGGANPATMRTANLPMNSSDRMMMDKFMTGETQASNNAFAFDHMRRELIGAQPHQQQSGTQGWVGDFGIQHSRSATPQMAGDSGRHASPGVSDGRWGAEFSNSGSSQQQQRQPISGRYGGMNGGMNFSRMSGMHGSSMMSAPVSAQAPQSSQIVELQNEDWEEQFRMMEVKAQTDESASKGKGISQESATAEQDTALEQDFVEDKNFDSVWNEIRQEVFSTDLQDREGRADWDRDYMEFTKARPDYGDYQFEKENTFLGQSDAFTIGVQLMDNGGRLSEAALAFEAAVQQDPKHVEAWSRLGAVQAQNEKEDYAVRALERCIDLDPNNLTALMNLAVAYTNESYENAAYSTLEKWISIKYPDIVSQAREQNTKIGNSDYQLHSRVTELFIKAAQMSPDGANIDASVQDGLGVLFYGNEEFDKAIDCFNAALSVRPNDPLLWNRLGATLANSQQSEEAIEAYSKALELRPSFVRARYNLGVSCVNIGCNHEAAQHLLTALSMDQEALSAPTNTQLSSNLLTTLRRIFLAMNRIDLADKVKNGFDIDSFRSEFDF